MVTTLRLSEELSAQLALMARVEGKSQAEIMREAITERFERCRDAEVFQDRLRELHERDRVAVSSSSFVGLDQEQRH